MMHTRLVSALKKLGATITERNRFNTEGHGDHFTATYKNQRIEWYTQKHFNDKTLAYDDKLWVTHVTMRSPLTDAQTDCFCDSYRETIKGAVQLLVLSAAEEERAKAREAAAREAANGCAC